MNNHYHLVIETPDGNLSKGMRQLNGVCTQAFNKRHGRISYVFQGRFKEMSKAFSPCACLPSPPTPQLPP